MNDPEIKVLKVTWLTGNRPLKAFVDVQIGSLTINDWRVLKEADGTVHVIYPQTSFRDQSGVIRYRSLLQIPSELKQRVDVEILSSVWGKELNGLHNPNARRKSLLME